jgi:Cu+-exporting ATPase
LICMSVVVVLVRPNTLGLSTSTAIIVGTGVGPKNGISVKDGCALKARRELRRVAPKETGTVTKGNLTMDC